jgi:ribokinase
MKYDVVSIGAATRDVFLRSAAIRVLRDDSFPTGEAECLSLGSKIDIDEILFETGGGGTNTAVGFARQGLKTGFFGRIGAHDARGKEIIEALRGENVDTNLVIKDPRDMTGYSVLLLTPRGERTVLVYRGASADFTAKEMDRSFSTKWIYVSSLGGDLAALKMLWKRAAAEKIQIAWNPGAKELALGVATLRPLIQQCAIFSVNQEEAAKLTGHTRHQDIAVFHELRSWTEGIVLLTQGTDGCLAALGHDAYHSGTRPVKVVDTTGAGDAFGCGFVGSWIRNHDIVRALQDATANSESVIAALGAKKGLLGKKTDGHLVPVQQI